MAEEGSPRVTRRSIRSVPGSSDLAVDGKKPRLELCSPSLSDLIYGDPISLDVLLTMFPERQNQILELIQLLGPLNSHTLPFIVYGAPSTGKTSVVLQLFRHLNRPFVYTSFRTCYNQRILFETILNQLLLHRRDAANGYTSAKRCDKPSDFAALLREAVISVVKSLKEGAGKPSSSSKSQQPANGHMVYLIFDNLELVQDWGKASSLLSFLFNLYDILQIPEVCFIFISNSSPDMFYSRASYVEPLPVYFPSYSEMDLHKILLRRQENKRLYTGFLDAVLSPFWRITRRLDELCPIFVSLYTQYCKPLSDVGTVPNEDQKRRLYSNLQPKISSALNEVYSIQSRPSSEDETNRNLEPTNCRRKLASYEKSNELDFHMSTSAKYLLISAFLSSRNPATLDASLFDSTGGSDSRKRRKKLSDKNKAQQETAEEESLNKGPGSFPLERLLAIYQCLTSVADGSSDEEAGPDDWVGISGENNSPSTDVLLQISSLCGANILVKGGSCPLEGSTRYRCMASEDLALKVARSLKFPLAKYIYRR